MPIDRQTPAIEARVKLRSRNSHMGMMGLATRCSTNTKTTAEARPATMSPMICGEAHSYCVPPHADRSTTELVKTAMRARPSASTERSPVRVAGSSRKKTAVEAIASRPSGSASRKAQRHPGPSVSQPPMSGPATEETAKTDPMMPMYLPRWRAGTTVAMIACDRIIMPPPPTPWTTRPTMSHVMDSAKKPMTDPTMKTVIAPMKSGLRPSWSPSLP